MSGKFRSLFFTFNIKIKVSFDNFKFITGISSNIFRSKVLTELGILFIAFYFLLG